MLSEALVKMLVIWVGPTQEAHVNYTNTDQGRTPCSYLFLSPLLGPLAGSSRPAEGKNSKERAWPGAQLS